MKPKIIIGVVIIVGALAFLIFSGFEDNASYYLTVSELYAKEDITPQDGVRIHGYVDPETIEWNAEAIEVHFDLFEESDTIKVYYKGVKPDQLADAQQVVAEGFLREDGVFQANKIMLKCPSKYEVDATEGEDRYDKIDS
jgi:cytochrome c-type biogenesis protein CcmE